MPQRQVAYVQKHHAIDRAVAAEKETSCVH